MPGYARRKRELGLDPVRRIAQHRRYEVVDSDEEGEVEALIGPPPPEQPVPQPAPAAQLDAQWQAMIEQRMEHIEAQIEGLRTAIERLRTDQGLAFQALFDGLHSALPGFPQLFYGAMPPPHSNPGSNSQPPPANDA